MIPKIKNFSQKCAHFGVFEVSFLIILGVQKVVSWTFSKLFWSCVGSLQSSFSVLKCPLLAVFEPFLILFTTHTCYSPLGSCEALINIDNRATSWFKNFTKLVRHIKNTFIVWLGILQCCEVGRIYLSNFLFEKKEEFFFFFFQMSLALRGDHLFFFFTSNKSRIELVGRKLT